MAFKTSDSEMTRRKLTEALRTVAYPDGAQGRYAIGYGHNPGPGVIKEGTVITPTEAEAFLDQDSRVVDNFLNKKLAGLNLTQEQYDQISDYTFNRGSGAVENSGIFDKLKSGDMQGVADIIRNTGNSNKGLAARRDRNADAFALGDPIIASPKGKASGKPAEVDMDKIAGLFDSEFSLVDGLTTSTDTGKSDKKEADNSYQKQLDSEPTLFQKMLQGILL